MESETWADISGMQERTVFSQDVCVGGDFSFLILYEDSSRVPQSGLSSLLARLLDSLFSLGIGPLVSRQATALPFR